MKKELKEKIKKQLIFGLANYQGEIPDEYSSYWDDLSSNLADQILELFSQETEWDARKRCGEKPFDKPEDWEKEFIVFTRPSCCVKDFLAQDCDGNYHRLQEINPKDFLSQEKQKWADEIKKKNAPEIKKANKYIRKLEQQLKNKEI